MCLSLDWFDTQFTSGLDVIKISPFFFLSLFLFCKLFFGKQELNHHLV